MDISAEEKRKLFNKGEHEPLTADEQAVWDDWASGNADRNGTPNLRTPDFLGQLRVYLQAKKDKVVIKKSIEMRLAKSEQNIITRQAKLVKVFYQYNHKSIQIAASILILIIIGIYWSKSIRTQKDENDNNIVVILKPTDKKVLPNSNKVMVTLSDNSQYTVATHVKGVIAHEGEAEVTNLGNQLVYQVKGPDIIDTMVRYNTLTTPRGAQYKMTLSDGTKIWLNANSTLRYPAAFKGGERIVQVTGEAYFEVAKDSKRPFIVESNDGSRAKVLGTSFNIKSYPGDSVVTTTLLVGKVEIKHGNDVEYLYPGQQAVVRDGKIQVKKYVETDRYIAWKDQMINLEGENIRSIMDQISRLYDVDVKYEGNPQANDLTRKVEKTDSLTTLLKGLDLALENVKFKFDGKTVIVIGQ